MIDTNKKPNSIFTILALFAIFSVMIIAGGLWWYGNQKKLTKKNWDETLESIARLKVDQISRWRQERINDALVIASSQNIVKSIQDHKIDATDYMSLKTWLEQIKYLYDYDNIYLLNSKGEDILHLDEKNQPPLNKSTLQLFNKSLATKKSLYGDFYCSQPHKKIHIDLIAPVIIKEDQREVTIGGIILIIDPQKFLYPLIQSWPTPSPSAETLLIRKEGDEVLFLNTLRHRKGDPLTFRLPLTDKRLPAARVIEGWEGALEGADYRGVPVLAVTKAIPYTPWHMVAKIDKAEIYSPLYREARVIIVAVISLILLVGAVLGWNLSRRRMKHYATICRLEQEREALLVHFEYLVKYANDIILLLDQGGNIKEANDRAEATYGYSRDELLKLNIRDLLASPELPSLLSLSKEKPLTNGIIYETRHRRHDGSTFPVEVGVNLIQIEGVEYFQEIIRNNTERKQAEEELYKSHRELQEITNRLEQSRDMLQLVIESIPVRVFWKDNDLRFMGCNTLFAHDAGLSNPEQLLGKDDFAMGWKEQAELYRMDDRQVMESRRPKMNIVEPQTTPGGDKIWLNTSKVPLIQPSGEVVGVLGVYEDITIRKQAEAELKLKERMLDGASDSIFLHTMDGNFLYVNEAAYTSLGYAQEELLRKKCDISHYSRNSPSQGEIAERIAGKR